MTKLAAYLHETGMTLEEFGRLIGCHKSVVSRLASGKRQPTLEQALRIAEATQGHVQPPDFLDTNRAA